MKQIKNYINERLHVTSKSFYTCQPYTKYELQKIIIQRIKDEGPECNLNDIDVSKIDDMSYLFNADEWGYGNKIFKGFNGDISLWDVSNVTTMEYMFYECENFDCDISKWDVSNVEKMTCMFWECKQFNCNMSRWNVSNVTDIACMFWGCEKFNCDLSQWDVSNVETMQNTFDYCPTKPKWYDRNKWENER